MPSPNEHRGTASKNVKPVIAHKRRGNEFTEALRSVVDLATSFENDHKIGVEKGLRTMMNNLAGSNLDSGFSMMLVNAADGGNNVVGLEKLKLMLGENFLNCVANVLGENNKVAGVEKILKGVGGGNRFTGLLLIMNQNGKHDYKDLGILANALGEGKRSEGLGYLFEALEKNDRYSGFVNICELIKEDLKLNSNLKAVAKLATGAGLGNTAVGFRDIINALGSEEALNQVVEFINPDNHYDALTNLMPMLSNEFSVSFQSLIAGAGGGFANKNGLLNIVGVKGISRICAVLGPSGNKKEGFTQLLAMQGNGISGLKNIILSLGGKDKQKGLSILCAGLGDGIDKTEGFGMVLDIIGEGNKEKGLTAILMMLGGS